MTFSLIGFSSRVRSNMHRLGVGDINYDGRMYVSVPAGWYEQDTQQDTWIYYQFDFGRGGAEMEVYDVNGDRLNDVVVPSFAEARNEVTYDDPISAILDDRGISVQGTAKSDDR